MGISERRELEKEGIKKKIIDAANEILIEDGYKNLSIRKIANRIEYSPGIIYHYFKDKAEIVEAITEEGYEKILKTIRKIPVDTENPERSLENILRNYIELVLEIPEQYRAIMMEDIGGIREKVNILNKGVSNKRKSMQALYNLIEVGVERGKFRQVDIELTAQIIWTSIYGLASRLIIEKDISKEQKNKLIDHYFEIIFKGLSK